MIKMIFYLKKIYDKYTKFIKNNIKNNFDD